MKEHMIKILSCDPGSTNLGWAVLAGQKVGERISFKVIANGMCPCPVNQVKNSKELKFQQTKFRKWFTHMVKKYDVDAVCAERFMTRGLFGPIIELVGIMLGIMMCVAQKKQFKVFPAVIWKNAVRRNTGEKEFLNQCYKKAKVPPHQFDAALMGIWTIFQGFKSPDFKPLDLRKNINKLFDQIEDTSETKLINRKMQR